MAKIPRVKLLWQHGKIFLQTTVPGTTKRLSRGLDVEVSKELWDSKNETVLKKHPKAVQLNTGLWQERDKVTEALKLDLEKKIPFTAAHLQKRLYFDYSDPAKDFYCFAREQVAVANYSPETRRTYYSEITKIEQYAPLLAFGDINYGWLQTYEQHMRDKLTNHPNTVWKSLKFINTMINVAIKVGSIIEKNPFANYKRGTYKQGLPDYITWGEAQKLHSELKTGTLAADVKLIGYYAMLIYYSGLRFSDAVKFDYSRKVTDSNGTRRLILHTQKTNEIVSVKFNKYIDEVVDFIRDKPLNIPNQLFNEKLKTACGAAKIKSHSSHSFRHGFAMHCCELGAGIDEVQRLMGHNKRSSTEIYFRMRDARTDEVMDKWE